MGFEAVPGEVYRLLLTFDGHETVPDVFRFDRFEQAQGWVAPAVRRHATRGRVRAVALQRGIPVGASGSRDTSTGAPGPGRPETSTDYTWTIEKRWGPEVVTRILAQQAFASRSAARRPTDAPAPSIAPGPRPSLPAAAAGFGRLHKDTRWHVIGTFTLVLLAILTTLLYQTGGNPNLLLAATKAPVETIKLELPFDARAGFVTIEPGETESGFRGRLRPFGFDAGGFATP